jgi:hypothetical protein
MVVMMGIKGSDEILKSNRIVVECLQEVKRRRRSGCGC